MTLLSQCHLEYFIYPIRANGCCLFSLFLEDMFSCSVLLPSSNVYFICLFKGSSTLSVELSVRLELSTQRERLELRSGVRCSTDCTPAPRCPYYLNVLFKFR